MYRMLFTNRWAALAFVALTVVCALAFVGTGPERESHPAVKQETPQPPPPAAQDAAAAQPAPAPEASANQTFSSDEELIDPATGADPSPEGDFGRSADANASDPGDGPADGEG